MIGSFLKPSLFGCTNFNVTIMVLFSQAFKSEVSQSKILDDAYDLLIDENTNNISSVLRKEIEGKIFIANDPVLNFLDEGKYFSRESFVDAKEELESGNSMVSYPP